MNANHNRYEIATEVCRDEFHQLAANPWTPIWWTNHKETKQWRYIDGNIRYFHYTLSPFYEEVRSKTDSKYVLKFIYQMNDEISVMNMKTIQEDKLYDVEYKTMKRALIIERYITDIRLESLRLIHRCIQMLTYYGRLEEFQSAHPKYKKWWLMMEPIFDIEDMYQQMKRISLGEVSTIMTFVTEVRIHLMEH